MKDKREEKYRTTKTPQLQQNLDQSYLTEELVRQISTSLELFANSTRIKSRLRLDCLKNNTQDIQAWFERQTSLWSEENKGHEVSAWLKDSSLRYWELMKETDKYDYGKIIKTL